MADIRIPLYVLQTIIDDLKTDPNKDHWRLLTKREQTIEIKRIKGTTMYGDSYDSLDFIYDPED